MHTVLSFAFGRPKVYYIQIYCQFVGSFHHRCDVTNGIISNEISHDDTTNVFISYADTKIWCVILGVIAPSTVHQISQRWNNEDETILWIILFKSNKCDDWNQFHLSVVVASWFIQPTNRIICANRIFSVVIHTASDLVRKWTRNSSSWFAPGCDVNNVTK